MENYNIILDYVKEFLFDDSLLIVSGIWSFIRIYLDLFIVNYCWYWFECLEDIYSIVDGVGFLCLWIFLGWFYFGLVFENWLEVIFSENGENYMFGERIIRIVVVGDVYKSKNNGIFLSRYMLLY